ncbi:intraflagellar transport protein 56 isoform X2 [Onthophagus taurus]|uniref:intraflagellar transport protein 56 isoform X2 n=1 Tax=Onthophagus taurus TaxID=166361 RepID=UPI000C205B1F|nr:intraflagellar transport protein 56 isoform X2 [Onthophagus taurus]
MNLSRSKPAITTNASLKHLRGLSATRNVPSFEEFLNKRDYTGALTLLEFKQFQDPNVNIELWMAYCAFHKGDYKKALNIYNQVYLKNGNSNYICLNLACCYFYLGMYKESKEMLQKELESCPLKIRLNFHLSHKLSDETGLMDHHEQLLDIIEDQLSLAAIHYLRAHYQESIDIYKRLLLQNRDNLALNVYIALCYYKLDYYDVSQEVLSVYLNQFPDSVIATNLKACNHFRLYNGQAAESELKTITDQSTNVGFGHDLVKHNLVVFRNGEGAMQVLPGLIDVVAEARLNLVIHHLKQNDTKEAYDLIKDLQPAVPQEYILKGVVNAALGQEMNSSEYIKTAEECFQLVGSSSSECDTIPGRQCMAAAFFLANQFEEVLVYLTSIKSYLHADDTFNFNYAQAKVACDQFKEAEETFLLIQDEAIKADYVYVSSLCRCYVMNGKPQSAWEMYLKMETGSDSFNLLLLIANDCYRMGEFWYAAKAFDMLDRLEPNPEFWEGKRGAIVGVFQGVIAKKFPVDMLGDVLQLLRNSTSSQSDHIAKVIRKWAKEKRISVI